jgi:acyl-CoA oxidase
MHALLSALKPMATDVAQKRIQSTREIMGGHGYSRINMIGLWRNNNDINLTWEGDNTVLIQQTARFIMKSFNRKLKGKEVQYKSLSFLSKFDNVSTDKNVIKDSKDLKNLDILCCLLEHRTNLLLQKSMVRLAEKVETKKKTFDAWNDSQVFYLQSLAKSYGELYLFDCFRTKIELLVESPTKNVLTELLELFSLVTIEKDLSLYRENDYLFSEDCDLIRNEILDCCNNLKDHFVTILDVISPPDEILGAPLGSSTGFIFENYLNHVFNSKGCYERPEWWDIIHHKKI